MQNPLLSICLITYKQEDYIQQAIRGVFEQELDFFVEFIISNDCSPDKTHEKIEEIIKTAPKNFKIRYFNHEKNLGALQNFKFSLNQCTGKYIAYFEGDDYWSFSKKIKPQIDFLENNPDFAICCHNIFLLEKEKLTPVSYLDKTNVKEISTIVDLAKFNFIATLTAVFRNVEEKFPEWILDSSIGDLPLFMMVAKHGKIKFINEKWAVYRSNIGEWSKMGNHRNINMIRQYDLLINEFKNNEKIKNNLEGIRNKYVKEYLKKEKMSLNNLLKDKYFIKLPAMEKLKVFFRKYIK